MTFHIPSPVGRALSLLEAAGCEAYLVGGCVRDTLRGEVPKDFDMTTSALPEEVLSVFREFRTVETGLRHGTVTVLIGEMPIEITTYRVDGDYIDHRRPESVSFTSSLIRDLERRDFTINAMAYNPRCGLADPFGGQDDLAAGVIRAVGEPVRRFTEDALRILRALRFSARFGFAIEEATTDAARLLAPTLRRIAAERIREELFGILTADHAGEILGRHADILSAVIPEAVCAPHLAALPPVLPLRLAELLLLCGESGAAEVLRRLRADNQTVRTVCAILRVYSAEIVADHAMLCRLLRNTPRDAVQMAFALRAAHGYEDGVAERMLGQILDSGECYRIDMLAVGGEDLAALGIPRGPLLGAALEEAYSAVIEHRVPNERETLLAFLSENKI